MAEINTKSKKVTGIKEMVLDIIENTCKNNDPPLTQKQINKKILYIKNKEINPNWEPTGEYDSQGFYETFQPSISKNLKKLCKDNIIIKKGNTYIPYNIESAREFIKAKIIKAVCFNRRTTFVLSSYRETRNKGEKTEQTYATCSLLVDVRFGYIATAKDLFREYIGDKNCYDISEFQGKVLIMLEGTLNEVKNLKKSIRDVVEETYDAETR